MARLHLEEAAHGTARRNREQRRQGESGSVTHIHKERGGVKEGAREVEKEMGGWGRKQ